MWWKLIFNSFRRDPRRKLVGMSAVALATCLATFLLNWSLNLGDKIQRELRAYGSNILIVPQGDALPVLPDQMEAGTITTDQFLSESDISGIQNIFWRNQIVSMAPLLQQTVKIKNIPVMLVGTEFGATDPIRSYPKIAPYVQLQGRWPRDERDLVCGAEICKRFGWQVGQEVTLIHRGERGEKEKSSAVHTFQVTGMVRSGGVEDNQLFARLDTVQKLTGRTGQFKQLNVSALVTPPNELYYKHQRTPDALTPQETERYFCTPYLTQVADDISKVFAGSEARIVKQVAQTEEKIVRKVNWLMVLVTLAGLIASSLTMTSTTTSMILERRKELALMKAVGSSNGFLVFYLFGEVLILGAIGSLVGYGVGSLLSVSLSRALFQSVFEIKLVLLPIVAAIGVFVIFCGSLWPLRQATTLDPAVALRDL
jgi:putative ABC transport system permease protein